VQYRYVSVILFGGLLTFCFNLSASAEVAYEAWVKSELFQAVGKHPNLTNITSRDFSVLEGPTRISHGLAAVAV